MADDHMEDKPVDTQISAEAQPAPAVDTAVVDQARTFLASPLIADEPVQAKRQFLLEKGLQEPQIELLLRQARPTRPPPTYPQPAPSSLPTLLLGIFRLFSYTLGISSAAALIYYRFLFPRIVQTSQARLSLKVHQIALLQKLKNSILSLKEEQTRTFAILPKPPPYREPEHLAHHHSVVELRDALEKANSLSWRESMPTLSFLRCAILDISRQSNKAEVPTEAIFEWLETHLGPLDTNIKESLWQTLNESSCFDRISIEDAEFPGWSYQAPPPMQPTALAISTGGLLSSFPNKLDKLPEAPAERLMNSLSTLTGYLSTAMYATPRSIAPGGKEDEIRKEIRALKGLSLNRKSFAVPTRVVPGSSS